MLSEKSDYKCIKEEKINQNNCSATTTNNI